MSKKLNKTTLAAALQALAAEESRDEAAHHARFEKLIGWAKSEIDLLTAPEQLYTSAARTCFADAVDIARRILRMSKLEFERATAVLNTPNSRVIDDCPSGKDHRDVPERMRMRNDELHMTYSLLSPYHAAEYISERGSLVGYVPADVARAKIEYTKLEKARRAKIAEEDQRRAEERHAKIEADLHEGYLRRLAWEAEHAEEHQAKLALLAAQEAAARPRLIENPTPVLFENDEQAPRLQMSSGELKEYARTVISEMQKLTKEKFERAWKTKDELHAALRDHFRDCGYDEELSFRWLRLGGYN